MKRVLVLRALMLGDILCATPALRALRAGLPGAEITLLALPWARGLAERLDSIDEFIEFPGWPGLPERPPDRPALSWLLARLRARRFDLAIQLHGSGGITNPLLASFGARFNAGFCQPGAWTPAGDAKRFLHWPAQGSELERLLALCDHLGLPRQGTALDFPLREPDRQEAARLLGALAGRPYAIVHPGAQLPSRRWPPARFAAVADALAARGLAIVLTGTADEAPLTAAVGAALRAPALDLAGRTSLWSLGALIEGAALMISNDTGVSHIAAALGRPSVVISSGGDAARWSPADGALHRVLWQPRGCRPCAEPVCPYALDGHSACGLAIASASVEREALRLLDARPPARESRHA
ncbi:glycosyltransferase family 9 protein [Roseateles violae]|uniref:Glycosyltransferase family 9 protein n=1 Tax=Roseateles violae TaxID=3058042 RepID=A0ABT8DVJ9_9BURK|nr:glycosyltransferase family 9 protein [Pelomonas sp. PFR6]MDN3922346.1 glycosyltransferase family 9 protein [Pelomonas sp. PFR6]